MSDNLPNLPGPSRKTLAGLMGSLRTYMKAKDEGVAVAKGKVHQVLRPRKFCKICGATWDRKFVDPTVDTDLESLICQKCDGMLKEGYVAIVSSREPQPIWTRQADLQEFAGTIVHVSAEVYAAAVKRIKELESAKKDDHAESN